jgi:hypothetical protein
MIDLDVLFHSTRIKVRHDKIQVKGRGLFDVRVGQRSAYIGFERADVKPFTPVQPRFWRGGVALLGPGEEAEIARRYGGMAGEIRSGGFHGVIEMQDGYIKSQVRRLVEGL